ncbi:MAG: hypothetical protein HYY26_02500, partial [Acidobacteria bacterium]|nr:hypothetical protein [Acidobacteriota bacterium]
MTMVGVRGGMVFVVVLVLLVGLLPAAESAEKNEKQKELEQEAEALLARAREVSNLRAP